MGLVVTAADQPRLVAFLHDLADQVGAPRPWRIRLVLLALIALAAAIMWMRRPVPPPAAPTPAPTQPAPAPADEAPEEDRIRIQPATGG